MLRRVLSNHSYLLMSSKIFFFVYMYIYDAYINTNTCSIYLRKYAVCILNIFIYNIHVFKMCTACVYIYICIITIHINKTFIMGVIN